MLDKIIKVANKSEKDLTFEIGSNSDLILENKVEGNLKDVLKGLDEDQINIIASVYYDEKNAFF